MERNIGIHLPLMANQKRLWILSQQDSQNPAYNILLTYHLRGEINTVIFRRSLELLFEKHHTMFSVFGKINDLPYVEIVPRQVILQLIDFSVFPSESRREEIFSFAGEDSRKPFDIEQGPLYRICLLKEDENSYYFTATIHHLIFDGFSRRAFVKELSSIYTGLANGVALQPMSLDFHSYHYAELEKDMLSPEKERELTEFWKEYLSECRPHLKFPFDFPRKKVHSGFGCREHFVISRHDTENLREICRRSDTTLFAALLSVMGLVFSKYSGENDICIGVPVSNRRSNPSLENIFGLFVSTVVVRLQHLGESSFREQILSTREAVRLAVSHSSLPFEKIVEEVSPERIAGINPFFQVALSWINSMTIPLDLNGITGDRITVNKGTSPFDISFYMWENEGLIEGEIEYNIDLLTQETIFRLKESFISLVHSVTENPDLPVSDFSVISESEKKKVLEFNDTDVPYENQICVHEKFGIQVREQPDMPAISDSRLSLSYKEFNDHANCMANYLIQKGVSVEDRVAVCVDRSVEMMIAIFGILKAGAAYLPLNPENPEERLSNILDESGVTVVLSTKSCCTNLPAGIHVVFLDDILRVPLSSDSSRPEVTVKPGNLAYVLYTSGSTGTPKGVMIEHHSVLNRLGWMQKAYPIGKADIILQKTPITFDVSVWELFWWAFNGASLVLLPKGGEKDPETIVEYIDKYKVTTMHFVPSMFATFFETITLKKLCGKLESLSRIFLSGEALPLKLVKEFNEMREFYSLPELINLYGPTEATVDVSYYNCPAKDIKNVYIGKPIDNTKLFVVDKKNLLQPIGVPGELIITGVNLARGYLNRPDLTNDKFFFLKISDDLIYRAYRSGDLVKLSSDGEIDYLGRLDNQIKIRGFRIELGDIEAKILDHPLVAHCAVIVTDKGDYKYLVAYVCLKPGNEISSDKLRKYLAGKLPDYMVPSFIIFLDELPLTSSGKINRKSLPLPDMSYDRQTIIEPTTKDEHRLLELWRALLKTENISTGDNFFDMGGNSILAINLANSISKEFNIALKSLMIFEYPTIKDLSEFLSGQKEEIISQNDIELEEKIQKKKNVNFRRGRD
jgi:amino acid adenylation domain-containing protein